MAITVKDLGEIIGFKIEDEEKLTAEEIKTFIDEKFVSRENATKDEKIQKAIVGKLVGSVRTKIKQLGEFDSKELDELKLEEMVDKLNEKFSTQITSLKEKGKEGNDKRVNDLQKELEDKIKSISDYKKALEEKETYIQTKEGEFSNTFKTYKINDQLGKIKSSLPFTDDFQKKEVLKTGFDAMINSKFKFALNDKDELEVFTADGNHIKHPKKAGEFLKPDELLLQEAESQGLIKKNNAVEKKPLLIPGFNEDGKTKTKVHPNAMKNAARVAV